jgi:hypothetical protein
MRRAENSWCSIVRQATTFATKSNSVWQRVKTVSTLSVKATNPRSRRGIVNPTAGAWKILVLGK